jgi:hypothetical protein
MRGLIGSKAQRRRGGVARLAAETAVIRVAITEAAYEAITTLPLGSEAYEDNTVMRGGDHDHGFYSPR